MVTPELRMENLINALCDELFWGLRSFYAAKLLYETKINITPTLFDTFYFSCLDESAFILSRITITKAANDSSLNLKFLFDCAKSDPSVFRYAKPDEVIKTIDLHVTCLKTYDDFLKVLKEQRDRNLAHLDRKHINQPDWRANQQVLNLYSAEQLYKDLVRMMSAYFLMFFGGEISFGDWEENSKHEISALIKYFAAYNCSNSI